MRNPKPWRLKVGALIAFLAGALLWWSAYEPDGGLLQKPQLLIVPAALGMFMVNIRNKRKRVGPYDPETIAKNKAGRV